MLKIKLFIEDKLIFLLTDPTSLPRKRKHGIKLKYNKMINKRTKKNTTNSIEIQTNVISTSKLTTKCD